MVNIKSATGSAILRAIAASRPLLAFDFDGTLAPIVADRQRAYMRPSTTSLLAELARRFPCAIISGRAHEDIAARVTPVAPRFIIGGHGADTGRRQAQRFDAFRLAHHIFEEALASVRGVDIEDKQTSLAIHYRHARNRAQARAQITTAATRLPFEVRLVPGKLVINVVAAHAPDKGAALLRLRKKSGVSTALYVGDDITDEDVFRIDQPGRLFSVRIGAHRHSAARYYLPSQSAINWLLRELLLGYRQSRSYDRPLAKRKL